MKAAIRRRVSVEDEHGLAREPPGHQILGDLADLRPRALDADVRRELTRGHEIGEPAQADGGRLAPEFREQIEAVERRTPGDEELSGVEGDLGRGRDAERDTDTARSSAARAEPSVRPPTESMTRSYLGVRGISSPTTTSWAPSARTAGA